MAQLASPVSVTIHPWHCKHFECPDSCRGDHSFAQRLAPLQSLSNYHPASLAAPHLWTSCQEDCQPDWLASCLACIQCLMGVVGGLDGAQRPAVDACSSRLLPPPIDGATRAGSSACGGSSSSGGPVAPQRDACPGAPRRHRAVKENQGQHTLSGISSVWE